MPQIGGKIWTAIDKKNGKPFIYDNDVVKFRDIAMRGPWTSGGLEANFGIVGHTPGVATPVNYLTRKNDDGSVSCIISLADLLTQTRWNMEINLPKDKAYFITRFFWHNKTSLPQPYYSWMNLGQKVSDSLEYIFPGNHYIFHDGKVYDFPINPENHKNISIYDQNDFGSYKSYHVTGAYSKYFGVLWQKENYGMIHYASNIENNVADITVNRLEEIANILECDPVYILNYKSCKEEFHKSFHNHFNQATYDVNQEQALRTIIKLQNELLAIERERVALLEALLKSNNISFN